MFAAPPYAQPPEVNWLLMEQNGLKGEARLLRQYGGRALDLKLGVNQPAQTHAQGRQVGGKEFGIRDQREISLQAVLVLANVLLNGFAAHLFLALDEEDDVDGKAARRFKQGFDGFDM